MFGLYEGSMKALLRLYGSIFIIIINQLRVAASHAADRGELFAASRRVVGSVGHCVFAE